MKILYKLKRLKDIALAYCKIFVSLIYVRTHKDLYKKRIWLITEKRDEARDNGYWLFKFIKETHPEVCAYYVIQSTALDTKKLLQWAEYLIEPDSWKHCVLFLAAEKNISSQNDGAHPFWKKLRHKDLIWWKKLANPKQVVIFLQHGIIKDEIPHESFDYGTNPMDCFVVSTEKERDYIVDTYGYPLKCVPNVGLCRFDNLFRNRDRSEKTVLVMPTWRKWLQPQQSDHKNEEIQRFKQSDYYKEFYDLLSSKELIEFLSGKGYKFIFYPHYEMQKYLSAFNAIENDVVKICSKEEHDVQELLIQAQILITDYSSVFFDFAYMNKPLIYFQFDYEEFSNTHFKKGYFDYETDGFGPVFDNKEQVVKHIIELITNDCSNPKEYQVRRKAFFSRFDGLNCHRNYEYIKSFKLQE